MILRPMRSVRVAILSTAIIVLALPPLVGRSGMKAATCMTNPVVVNNSDSGAGSLRQAIVDACDGSTVTFANTVASPITLASELAIDKNLTIQGPGANALTISGNHAVRVFNIGSVNPAINVTLSGVTITNGSATAINSTIGVVPVGGGVFNNITGTFTVTNCTFSGNNAVTGGGGIFDSNPAILNVSNSTFSGNSGGSGGALGNLLGGTITITNSTFAGNTAGDGFAIIDAFNGTLRVTNSTFSGNGAVFPEGEIVSCISNLSGNADITNSTFSSNDAGIKSLGSTTNVKNTIVGLNRFFDVSGGFASQGHNLIGRNDFSFGFTNGVNADQVGSSGSPIDPKLGPLQNNGGPTLTMALLPGSPAIDAGDDSVVFSLFLNTDQRGPGFPRKSGLHVDIGAFEFQFFFQACLKDNITGNVFQFDSTGKYKFTRCSDGFMVSGTGVVQLVNGMLTLTDSKPDRRVSAGFITSQRTGSATIYIMIGQGVWQTFRINSTNPSAPCGC
jgi:hypothetical protein